MLLDGNKLKDIILDELKDKIKDNNYHIKLAIILVGDNEASKIYIKNKEFACKRIGIDCLNYTLDKDTTEEDVIKLINKLNKDDSITGIILQSPVPKHIDYDKCSSMIDASKDVDGFTKENIYKLYLNQDPIMPCTVKGIIRILDEYHINLEGANVVIVGRGNIVGKPLALALLNRNAIVTIAHSHANNLKDITKRADIVISAAGRPLLIKEDMVKSGAIVIDVGVTRNGSKIVGDVDFNNICKKATYITPNPGGVGPMTVAMIMENLVEIESRKHNG